MSKIDTKTVIGMMDIEDYLNKFLDNKYIVKGLMESLKLQELVKEEIKENYKGFADIERLQEILKESEGNKE